MTRDENVVIRCEKPDDQPVIRLVNEATFGRPDEANLIDDLRKEGGVILSLIAEIESRMVGHVLFSRMWIDSASDSIPAIALAPIAVLPAYQRKGIGGMLIRSGLHSLREQGEHIVTVLGHPAYYSRFGFSTGQARGLKSPFPPDAFMALELNSNALHGTCGTVRYPNAFRL